MVTFAWVVLIILSMLGVGTLVVLALPAIFECFKVLTYKCKKNIQTKKIDIDAKDETKRVRNVIRRKKEDEVLDKKLELDMKKADIKIGQYQKKIDGDEEVYEEDAVTGQEVIDEIETSGTVR